MPYDVALFILRFATAIFSIQTLLAVMSLHQQNRQFYHILAFIDVEIQYNAGTAK